MTRKPFVEQSTLVDGLLDLIHTNVYGSLNTQARGGFSYFIIFTNDHSRYGYVYLMRYKSEAFVRSARMPQPPLRYAFLGVMGQLVNDPKTYGEAMSNIDSGKCHEAMKSEMDSISLNQVWKLVDQPKSVKPVGSEGFTVVGEEHKVCHLQSSIYGLKQAFRSWKNICFDEVIRSYNFIKNDFYPCVYKKVSGSSVVVLVLYVDDILLIRNNVKMLGDNKAWLSSQFSMKDLCETSYIHVDEQGEKFSFDHNLIDGDALAFQLFLPLVYNSLITRVDGFAMTTNEKMRKWTRRDSLPQIRRRLHIRFKNKLQALESTSVEKNQGITLNFRDPKSYIGHIYILAAIEYFSKWVEIIPLKEVKKETVVDFIRINIIFRYEVPRQIPSVCIVVQEGLTAEDNAHLRLEKLEALDEKRLEAQQQFLCYKAYVTKSSTRKFDHSHSKSEIWF
ncbi:Retrovirus-related Pol polyprotein from transposon TNT 1-94 [Sesamum angolense]|uniref:Retrovirus-related Pol polyprotein from transposon TNT 1-94 n=1 Tax=Sesamum angolense TaxID=2727404 RepID=A0AAE1W3E0_9LAMI|nr:Retrovirus-related Pol polyprotein from transposon TNT 1-94 [Sesamum angolense]